MTVERPLSEVVPRFVLASGSPRRQQLLKDAGYQFEIVALPIEEISHSWLTVRELTLFNARRKTLAAAQALPDAVVLGADTLVSLEDEVLGKPADLQEAVQILRRLSGRSHQVWTAVCLCHSASGRWQSFHVVSRVQFRDLTDRAIQDYFKKVNPLDKAGAYAAQGHGKEIIQRVEGSYSNVVGLPMEMTARMLGLYGINPKP